MIGSIVIVCRYEAPVDVKRRRGASVPKPVGNGTEVDARGQKLGRYKVPQVVEPNVCKPDLLRRRVQRPVTMSGRQGRWPSRSVAKISSDSSRFRSVTAAACAASA